MYLDKNETLTEVVIPLKDIIEEENQNKREIIDLLLLDTLCDFSQNIQYNLISLLDNPSEFKKGLLNYEEELKISLKNKEDLKLLLLNKEELINIENIIKTHNPKYANRKDILAKN